MPASKSRRPITVDDLLRMRTASSPAISPDGARVVWVEKEVDDKNGYRTQLWIADVEDGQPRRFTHGERDRNPVWTSDGTRIVFVRGSTDGPAQVAIIDVDGGEAAVVTDLPEGALGPVKVPAAGDGVFFTFRATADEWTKAAVEERKAKGLNDPPRVIDDPWYRFDGVGYFDAQRAHLMRLDLATRKVSTIYDRDRLGFFSWDVSPDGRSVALTTNRHKTAFARDWFTEVVIVDVRTRKLRVLPGVPKGAKSSIRWSPDGERLAWCGRVDEDGTGDHDNTELFIADARTGGAKSLTGKEDYCLAAPTLSDTAEIDFAPQFRWHPDGKRLWLQIGWHGETHLATVSASGGPIRFHTRGRRQVRLESLSSDGRRVAVTVETATIPSEVHVIDVPRLTGRAPEATLETHPVSTANKQLLGELELSTPRAAWVTAPDGHRCQVWFMLPPRASAKRPRPTVLEIHGGPQTQYGYSFFHEFQVLAAAGHAVVYSNPRGSKGYGREATAAIRWAWGTKDWEDVEAVTDWMSRQTWCDESRMGIMGGSFGGYMTLWAIGHSRAYKAAISDRCVSNMVSMWGSSDVSIWPDTFFPGNTWDRTGALWDMSPLKHLGKARTPTLFIHSEGDLRCNVAESDQAYSALTVRGVPTRYVRYPRTTSHGMSRSGPPDMKRHRLGQILDWWAEWLK